MGDFLEKYVPENKKTAPHGCLFRGGKSAAVRNGVFVLIL